MPSVALQTSGGNGRANGATITQVTDTNTTKMVAQFADGSTQTMYYVFYVPETYLEGNATLDLFWRANATSGVARWSVDYYRCSHNGSIAAATALTGTAVLDATTDATALDINKSALSLTLAGGSSGDNQLLVIGVSRLGGHANDTLSATAELLNLQLTWGAMNNMQPVQFMWLPANAWCTKNIVDLVSMSSRSMTAGALAPYALDFNDPGGDNPDGAYAFCRFTLPPNYAGKMRITSVFAPQSTSSVTPRFAIGAVGRNPVGGDAEIAVTWPAVVSLSITGSQLYIDQDRAASLTTMVAGDEVQLGLWWEDDGPGVNPRAMFIGALVSYDVLADTPICIYGCPQTATEPAGNAAVLAMVTKATTGEAFATEQFIDAATSYCDYTFVIPNDWRTWSTLRIRWMAQATGNVVWQASVASPAPAGASDPTVTAITSVVSASNGVGKVNEATIDLAGSAAIAAQDVLILRIARLGSDGSDTLSDTAEVIGVVLDIGTF